MELHRIRGGSEGELIAKKYNIGVGVSLGNKWFTTENTLGLIDWSLEHTKDHVIVYVADTIHAINVEVRKRVSLEKAQVITRKMGRDFLQELETAVKFTYPDEVASKIHYATWDNIATPEYQSIVSFLYSKFDDNTDFREAIMNIVRNWIRKENRAFEESDIIRFSHYIIEELPECLMRVPINDFACDAYTYPNDGELPEFIESIQKGIVFPEIFNEIPLGEPKVFLEVR